MQKKWIDLLGCDTDCTAVDGCDIIRIYDDGYREILWSFDTHQQAISSYRQWIDNTCNEACCEDL